MTRWLPLLGAMVWGFLPAVQAIEHPQRIVSMNLAADQLLLQLVPKERIAALSWLADDPQLSFLADEAKGLPRIRGGAEEIARLRPDLVIGVRWGHGPTMDLLRRFDIPVLELPLVDSYDGIRETIRQVAEAVGEPARGEELIREMDQRIAALRARNATPTEHERPSAAYFGYSGFSGGASSLSRTLLVDAGFTPVTGRFDLEQLLRQPPGVIVDAPYEAAYPTEAAQLLSHPALRRLDGQTRLIRVPFALLICENNFTPRASEHMTDAYEAKEPTP